jgi:hypothetical protein
VEMDSVYPRPPFAGASTIRFLKLRDEGPVECTLATVDLDSYVKFLALSYTWGTALYSFEGKSISALPKDTVYKIIANGRSFVVTENMFDVLWELRFYCTPCLGDDVSVAFFLVGELSDLARARALVLTVTTKDSELQTTF